MDSTVFANVARSCPDAAQVLAAAARIANQDGMFSHFPVVLKVFGKQYEIGLKFLIEHRLVLVKAGVYRINPSLLTPA